MEPALAVPRLATALSGPLPELERTLLGATAVIEHWLRGKWQEYASPFYASVDLRNSGFKIAPVDTNLLGAVKEGLQVHDVLVQEGVYSFETVEAAVAEPVVYMIDHFVVGGFYRVHNGRGKDENLNAPGMHFAPLAFAAPCSLPDPDDPGCPPNRFYAYGVVARLALLAAAVELQRTESALDDDAQPLHALSINE